MAAFNKIQQFVEDLGLGVHNLDTGALTFALTTLANKPVATNEILGNLTQISYTNLSTRVLASTTYAHTTGTARLLAADHVLTASGAVAPFGAVVLYNDTPSSPADPLICWWEHTIDVTLADTDTFTIDIHDSNGILAIV